MLKKIRVGKGDDYKLRKGTAYFSREFYAAAKKAIKEERFAGWLSFDYRCYVDGKMMMMKGKDKCDGPSGLECNVLI